MLLMVFLAGMGFNELMHGCFGRCPSKCPRQMQAMRMPNPQMQTPAYTDGAGTVIIINAADGNASMPNIYPHHPMMGGGFGHHAKRGGMHNPQFKGKPEAPRQDKKAETEVNQAKSAEQSTAK